MSKALVKSAGYGDSAPAALLRRLPDSVERRHLRDLLAELERAYIERIDAAAANFKPDDVRAFMLRFLGAAMSAGAGLAGWKGAPSDEELKDLAALVEAELEYLGRYAASASEDVRGRSKLYGGAVESAFYRGWMHRLPTSAVIDWQLGVAEHCLGGTGPGPCQGGCVRLRRESPYDLPGRGRNPLPTVPRNGDTFCNANCKCFLVARYGGQATSIEPEIGAEVTAIGGAAQDASSQAARTAAEPLQAAAELVGYRTRLASLGANVDLYGAIRQFEEGAARLGVLARNTATTAEMVAEVSRARAFGMRWLNPSRPEDWELIIGVAIAIIQPRRGAVAGKVEAWTVQPPSVTVDGVAYRLDDTGRNLAFVASSPS